VKFTYCPSATDATESCAKCPQLIGTDWWDSCSSSVTAESEAFAELQVTCTLGNY
jgi:hypothetical protein